jgi:hypothetical protein
MTRHSKKPTPHGIRLFILSLKGVVLLGTLLFTPVDASQAESAPVASYQVLNSFTGNDGHGFNGDTDGANPSAAATNSPSHCQTVTVAVEFTRAGPINGRECRRAH